MTKLKDKKKESIGYKGLVEVGIVKNGKKIKRLTANTGTLALFNYLCGCLSGTVNPNYNLDVRPGAIRMYTSNNSVLSYGIKYNNIEIVPEEVVEGGVRNEAKSKCSVIYEFLIPGTAILNRKISKVRLMPLFDTNVSLADENSYYAEAPFDIPITVTDIDTNLYVSWTLTIKNEIVGG